jgi:hypothetical protein
MKVSLFRRHPDSSAMPQQAAPGIEPAPARRFIQLGEIVDEVERIVHSASFQAEHANGSLLRFLVECMRRQVQGVNTTTDLETFVRNGMPAACGQDPSVPGSIGALRCALKQYYLDEGRANPLRIRIPYSDFLPRVDRVQRAAAHRQPPDVRSLEVSSHV